MTGAAPAGEGLRPQPSPVRAALLDALGAAARRRCDELGTLSEEPGRLTRTFLSPPMREVQARLRAWMEAAGMAVRQDAAGNVIGTYAPEGAAGPAFLLGSHVDTVRDAGRYDGVLGVTLAIAAVEAIRRLEIGLPFPLQVLAFSEEEGARFGVPFLGSRAVVGTYDAALLTQPDAQGVSVAAAIRNFGNDPGAIPEAEIPVGAAFGYLEAHIEQGPVLESMGAPLGVVSAITSQSRLTLTFGGRSGHAGTTPMGTRQDALGGAAAFVLLAEAQALATPGLVAMLFLRSPGGISHHPDETVLPGDVALAVQTIVAFLERLGRRRTGEAPGGGGGRV